MSSPRLTGEMISDLSFRKARNGLEGQDWRQGDQLGTWPSCLCGKERRGGTESQGSILGNRVNGCPSLTGEVAVENVLRDPTRKGA